MPRNRFAAAVTVAALAGAGVGAGAVALTHDSPTAAGTTTTVVTAGTTNVSNNTLSVGQIAKNTTKSVVEIDATSGGSSFGFGGGSGQSSSAEGTGFVYDTKGDIVTNEHVVDGASTLTVKFSDGSTYKATLVGSDPSTDVAVIHVNAPASKLSALTLADSSNVSVGDGVVAIGNPFGLDGTVTAGIVSALGREITAPNDTPIEGAIQTDAAINHGNSGGPLLNMKGQVIGITSQIQSDSGGNDGVGFAVPSNTVRTIVGQLLASGKAQHALLGVTPATVSGGVKVSEVVGAAKTAGVKVGDVITGVDSTQVTSSQQLRAIIAGHKPGDKLTLTVRRNGKFLTLQATLGTRTS